MIINEKLKTKWTRRNKKYYESQGYIYTFINEELIVDIKDAFKGDISEVEVLCDFCKEEIIIQTYKFAYNQNKHTCKGCRKIKRKETCLEKYGEEFPTKNKDIKNKIVTTLKETCLEKYGVDNAAKAEIIQEKIKKTNLEKYGCERPTQSKEVKEKTKQTCINTYGVDHPWKSESVKEKIKNTNLKKYGVDNPWKSKEIQEQRKGNFLKKYEVDNPAKSNEIKEKTKETCLEKYGVDNPFKSIKIQEKAKKTNLEKYNVDHPWKSKEIQEKTKETFLKKYGVDNPLKSMVIQEKIKITCLCKYGVNNPLKSKIIREKIKKTNLKKYGVDNPFKNKEIKEKIREKMYKNGTAPASTQQRHICNLINGELNYPVSNCSLDIAFPNEMIYIEYDGGGHDLSVKLGNVTKEQFKKYEIQREYYLKSFGWKIIRFISSKDNLPKDEMIIKLIKECREYLLNSDHTWIEINVDESLIKCTSYIKEFADKHSK